MAIRNLLFSAAMLILLSGCQSSTARRKMSQLENSVNQIGVKQQSTNSNSEGLESETVASKVATNFKSISNCSRTDDRTTDLLVRQVSFDEETTGQSTDATINAVPISDANSICDLNSVEIWALSVNPAIQQATAELESLQGKRVQVGLCPNPNVGFSGDDINEDGSAGRYGVFVGNTIIRGNKLCLARATVNAEIEVKERQLAELQQRLVTDVRTRYFDLVISSKQANLTQQLVKLSRDAAEASRQLVEAKEIARTALLQAELELETAEMNLKRANNELIAARRNLATLLNEPELPFDSFDETLEQFGDLLDIENAYKRLLQESPEISRLHANVEVSRRNLAQQCAEQIVNLSWQTGVAYDTATDDVVTNFQIGMPIQRFNRNQGSICQARHQIITDEKRVEKRALQLRERLVEAYRAYSDAKLQVDAMKTEILPRAEETLQLVLLGYREGEVSFLELLTAQRTYFQFNLNNIQQQREMWRQRILIEGYLLSNNLQN